MRFRLVPRDEGFYVLFNEAAENLAESARLLRDLLDDPDRLDLRGRRQLGTGDAR